MRERVPQYDNFDFIESYQGALKVIYYDNKHLKCFTDINGVPLPAMIALDIPGERYDLEKVIERLKCIDNVWPYEDEYQIESGPAGNTLVWIKWLGSDEEVKAYINPHGGYPMPYYVFNELLGLDEFNKAR